MELQPSSLVPQHQNTKPWWLFYYVSNAQFQSFGGSKYCCRALWGWKQECECVKARVQDSLSWKQLVSNLSLGQHQSSTEEVNLPPLLALELVDWSQDVTQGTPCLKIQETLGLNTQKQQWGHDVSATFKHGFRSTKKCECAVLTGSFVRAGLLTLRPNASSWNCSSWTTRPAKDLLEGESFWTYWDRKEMEKNVY